MTTSSLIDALFRDAIGFDYLSRFGTESTNLKYPPHNILKNGDNRYSLVLAVAGFSRDELDVSVQGNCLKVKGTKYHPPGPGASIEMLYQGLALRDFERSWQLGEQVEVTSVSLIDGLLTVNLEKKMPEAKKIRTFSIS